MNLWDRLRVTAHTQIVNISFQIPKYPTSTLDWTVLTCLSTLPIQNLYLNVSYYQGNTVIKL